MYLPLCKVADTIINSKCPVRWDESGGGGGGSMTRPPFCSLMRTAHVSNNVISAGTSDALCDVINPLTAGVAYIQVFIFY